MKSKQELFNELAMCSEHTYTNCVPIKHNISLGKFKEMVGELEDARAERDLEYARRGLLPAHLLRKLSKPIPTLSPLSLCPPRQN